MAEILVFDNFEMTIIRSARRKTAAIKVDLDGASVRVPQDLSASRIRELVAEKTHWIEQKLAVAEQKRRDLALQNQRNAALGNGSLIPVQGRDLVLELHQTVAVAIAENAGKLVLQAPRDLLGDVDQLRALIEQWLFRLAVQELNFCINVYKQKVGVMPTAVQIKDYRARWGSCKPDGSVQLNWRLIHAPMHIMDYVVIHELCHLLEMNHSKRFWLEVQRVDPQYRVNRKWLKDNGWRLTL